MQLFFIKCANCNLMNSFQTQFTVVNINKEFYRAFALAVTRETKIGLKVGGGLTGGF